MGNSSVKSGIGIWLDSNIAFIVKLNDEEATIESIESNIEHKNYKAGRGSSTAYRFQAVKSEKSQLEKEKHQFTHFFEEIVTKIGHEVPLFIFGPAEAKTAFTTFLKDKNLDGYIMSVETQGKMTENQIKAHVKNFFSAQ